MRLVCIGNPIREQGRFVDLIRHADRDRADKVPPRLAVNAIRIPSTESPHAHREKSPFGLAVKTRIDSMHRKYGKDGVGGPPTFRHPENVGGPKCPWVAPNVLVRSGQVTPSERLRRSLSATCLSESDQGN